MKCIEEESICNIIAFYDCPENTRTPHCLFENLTVNGAVSIFKTLDLHGVLTWLDINPEEIPSGSFLDLFIQMFTAIDDSLPEDTWPVIWRKHWEF